jgi:hypothetical protein
MQPALDESDPVLIRDLDQLQPVREVGARSVGDEPAQ